MFCKTPVWAGEFEVAAKRRLCSCRVFIAAFLCLPQLRTRKQAAQSLSHALQSFIEDLLSNSILM